MNIGPSYVDLCRKVTELKDENSRIANDAARKLSRCQDQYHAILETVDAHLSLIDHNYRILWANRMVRRAFGNDIMGKPCHAACQGKSHPSCQKSKCLVRDAFRTGTAQKREIEMIDLHGRRRYFKGSAHIVRRNAKGEAAAVVKVFKDITEQKTTEIELKKRVEKLRKNLAGAIKTMVKTVEIRDPYIAGHQRRTADIARNIAVHMKMSEKEINRIRIAGVLHDLGKISVPVEILGKPGKICVPEYSLIQNHPQTGYDILKGIDFNGPIADVVLQHHERMDGSGYPFSLKGDQIRIEARIIGVADVIDAMSSHRSYRRSLGKTKAFSEIVRNSGTLYDSDVVDAAIKLYSKRDLTAVN